MPIQPVILAGGTGTRLWPLSRELYPKQLISLTGKHSLLQTTLVRVSLLPDALPPIIVVGEEHRFLTRSQVEELDLFPEYHLLLEPLGKDTAPAICGAALFARQQHQEALFVRPLMRPYWERGPVFSGGRHMAVLYSLQKRISSRPPPR